MKKYQIGLEFNPKGDVISSKGLIGGREVNEIRKKIKLNQKRNTYIHAYYDSDMRLIEIWKLSKKEYDELRCGFGLTNFGDFLKSSGLI